jgi:hypothetical protein
MRMVGDGNQDLFFYLMNIESVLRDLMSDPRVKNHQFFGFKEYTDGRGVRVCGEANGSVSFQYAAERIGPQCVPLSIVIYIDQTFIKNGIDVRPIYSKSFLKKKCFLEKKIFS